jgi:drug/metabolite transporter (DMT)-like permease
MAIPAAAGGKIAALNVPDLAAVTPRPDDLPRGAVYMTAAGLLFAGMGMAVKLSSAHMSNAQVVFLRNGLGLLALLPFLHSLGARGLRTRHFGNHLLRALAGLASMYCYFYALARMRLPDAILLNYSTPLLLPLVERVWLKEPLPSRLWAPIGLGFLGITLVLKPGFGLFQPAAAVALLAAVFGSAAQVGVRRLTATEPAARIVFYFAFVSTVLAAGPASYSWVAPPVSLWWILLAMGILATLGQMAMTGGYAQAPAAQVGPFIYTAVVFAAALDWLILHIVPDALSLAGALLVTAAAALALRMRTR